MKIGVIGLGVVGSAAYTGMQSNNQTHQMYAYDKFKPELGNREDILNTDLVFICVPSLTKENGEQDLSPLEETFAFLGSNNYQGVAVIKSTVVPGTTRRMKEKYKVQRVCHNPEFLTAARPLYDFLRQRDIPISGHAADCQLVVEAYVQAGFDRMICGTYEETEYTEVIKYNHNCGLSVKIAFANEIATVCKKLGLDYEKVRQGTAAQGGITLGHSAVPGPDGKPGFSGACFPKDTHAFQTWAKNAGIKTETLDGAIELNNRIRPGNRKEFKGGM